MSAAVPATLGTCRTREGRKRLELVDDEAARRSVGDLALLHVHLDRDQRDDHLRLFERARGLDVMFAG